MTTGNEPPAAGCQCEQVLDELAQLRRELAPIISAFGALTAIPKVAKALAKQNG